MWQADGDDHVAVSPSHLVRVMDLHMMMVNSSSHSTALQCWSLVLQHRYSNINGSMIMIPPQKTKQLPFEIWRQNYSSLQEFATLNCYMFAKFFVAAPS
jgi:hypothetical protein